MQSNMLSTVGGVQSSLASLPQRVQFLVAGRLRSFLAATPERVIKTDVISLSCVFLFIFKVIHEFNGFFIVFV